MRVRSGDHFTGALTVAMDGPCFSAIFFLLATLLASVNSGLSPENSNVELKQSLEDESQTGRKLELQDGVYLEFPKKNDTGKVISLEIDFNKNKDVSEGRGKSKKLMQRILPLFIMPFLMQSAIVPFFLSMLKFMLFKSLMVGKLALSLIILNAFRNSNSFKGRHDGEIANVHYGYHGNGMEEYGAYVN